MWVSLARLNPFFFRAGFEAGARPRSGGTSCLNPFFFRAGFEALAAEKGWDNLGLNPFFFRAGFEESRMELMVSE